MAHLTVKHFGAIKSAEIDIRKYNFYIGETSSGKSMIAKLIAIFNHSLLLNIGNGDIDGFRHLLRKYNIDFEFGDETCIKYTGNNGFYWEIGKDKLVTNSKDAELIKFNDSDELYELIRIRTKDKELLPELDRTLVILKYLQEKQSSSLELEPFVNRILNVIYDKSTPIYIPAERLLISMFSNSIFHLLQTGASIPDCIKDFGSLYESSRQAGKRIDIDILDMQVVFSNDEDRVFLKKEGKEIRFSQASSGLQSIIPLWTVLSRYLVDRHNQIFIIEEPESNLFPSTQHRLLDWMMGMFNDNENNNNIVITTHSPYVLSAVDNLILAKEIIKKDNSAKTIERVNELIPSSALIDFDDVSSYFFHTSGEVKDIRDAGMKSLGAEYIDGASDELGRIFNQLCEIADEL